MSSMRSVEHAERQCEERVVLRSLRGNRLSKIPYTVAPPKTRRNDEEPHRALRAPRVMGDLSGTITQTRCRGRRGSSTACG